MWRIANKESLLISFSNLTEIKLLLSSSSLWVSSQGFYLAEFWGTKGQSSNRLENLIIGSKLFSFGKNSHCRSRNGWLTFSIICWSLGSSSFYNKNVIKLVSRLASKQYILGFLIKRKNCHFLPDEIRYFQIISDGKAQLLVTCEDGSSVLSRRPWTRASDKHLPCLQRVTQGKGSSYSLICQVQNKIYPHMKWVESEERLIKICHAKILSP